MTLVLHFRNQKVFLYQLCLESLRFLLGLVKVGLQLLILLLKFLYSTLGIEVSTLESWFATLVFHLWLALI